MDKLTYFMQFYVRPSDVLSSSQSEDGFSASCIYFRLKDMNMGPIPYDVTKWNSDKCFSFWGMVISLLQSIKQNNATVYFLSKPEDKFLLVQDIRRVLKHINMNFKEIYRPDNIDMGLITDVSTYKRISE